MKPSPLPRYGRALVAVATAGALLLGTAPASQAQVVQITDRPDDALFRFDIRRVTYTNADKAVRTRIYVPELERVGTARMSVGRPSSDVAYIATIALDGRGKATKSFARSFRVGTQPRNCPGMEIKWVAAKNFIKFSVPQRCLRKLEGVRTYNMRATLGRGERLDVATAMLVRQGEVKKPKPSKKPGKKPGKRPGRG